MPVFALTKKAALRHPRRHERVQTQRSMFSRRLSSNGRALRLGCDPRGVQVFMQSPCEHRDVRKSHTGTRRARREEEPKGVFGRPPGYGGLLEKQTA